MKKSEILKRFLFVPVAILVMLVLISGYVVLDVVGFWQRPAFVAEEIGDAEHTEQAAFDAGTNIEKITDTEERIDINSAAVETLMRLPGIGEVKAQAIVGQRIKMQGFYSVDDLVCTDGIGAKILENLRELITVSEYKGER